jgi:hypothetical protein
MSAVRDLTERFLDKRGYLNTQALAKHGEEIVLGPGFCFSFSWIVTQPRYYVLVNRVRGS